MNVFKKILKGILLQGETADPSDNLNGSIWQNSTSNRIKTYVESAVREVVTTDQTQTLSNKSIDGDTSTITNIDNDNIKANAAIDATKIANGSVSSTEYQYLDGVTSNIQTQLDSGSSGLSAHISDTTTHGTTGDIVGTSDSQTLTNKTLTTPIISSISNTGILTLPTTTDTLVGRATTDTLTNKTLNAPILSNPVIDIEIFSHQSTPTNPSAGFLKVYAKNDDSLYTLDSSGTETELGASGGGGANTALSNLASVAFNANLNPSSDNTRSIGTTANRVASITSVLTQVSNGSEIVGRLAAATVVPSGATVSTTLNSVTTGSTVNNLGVFSHTDIANNADAGPSVYIETGNKTTGTGNSGNISLQTGTSAGGARGEVDFNALAVDFNSTPATKLNSITSAAGQALTLNSLDSNSNIVLNPHGSGTVDVSTSRITSVTDPTSAQDAATKAYVDASLTNLTVRSITSTDSVTTDDDLVLLSGASFTLTLPTAVGVTGKPYTIQHAGTSLTQIYTLATTSGQTIGGIASGSYALYTNGETLYIISNGSNWTVLDHRTQNQWSSTSAITIGAVTTPPTKSSTPATFDTVRWRRNGTECEVEYRFGAVATTGANNGSGDYKLVLPVSASSNIPVYTGSLGANDANGSLVGYGSAWDSGATTFEFYALLYDTSNVRVARHPTNGSASFWGSGAGGLAAASTNFSLILKYQVSGWQP